jgi:hypothetical protein
MLYDSIGLKPFEESSDFNLNDSPASPSALFFAMIRNAPAIEGETGKN